MMHSVLPSIDSSVVDEVVTGSTSSTPDTSLDVNDDKGLLKLDGKNNVNGEGVNSHGAKTNYRLFKGCSKAYARRQNFFTQTSIFNWGTYNWIKVDNVDYEFKIDEATYNKILNLVQQKKVINDDTMFEIGKAIVMRTGGQANNTVCIAIMEHLIKDALDYVVRLTCLRENKVVKLYNDIVSGNTTGLKSNGFFKFLKTPTIKLFHDVFGVTQDIAGVFQNTGYLIGKN